MEGLNQERKQIARLAASVIGTDPRLARINAGQRRMAGQEADMLAFPVDIADYANLQVLTVGANFGKSYYMAGYDKLGDPNHPLGP